MGSISKQLVKVNLTKYISAKRRFVEQKTKLCTEKKPVKQSNGIRSQKKTARYDISNSVVIALNEKPAEIYFVKKTNIFCILYGLIHNHDNTRSLKRRIVLDGLNKKD